MRILCQSVLWLGLAATPGWAQDNAIGYVKTAVSEASVLLAGSTTAAQPGTPVLRGAVLKTGKQGSMGITFKDNTVMSIGPDTELVVDEYLYAPARGELKLAASLARGSLQYVSGVIAKLKPQAVSVNTPAGSIGVRGTRFLVRVEPQGAL